MVDPNGLGASDVIDNPTGTATPIANPVPDPLDVGTRSLAVGSTSDGAILVQGGGQVAARYAYVGLSAGSTGSVVVTDAGSQWNNNGGLYVGSSGAGEMSIFSGGVVTSAYGGIGVSDGSTGSIRVDGADSLWNSSTVNVGNHGVGELTVTGGGRVASGAGTIGFQAGSAGAVSVAGAGSRWDLSQGLVVGQGGTAALSIATGGVIDVAGTTTVNSRNNGSRITLDGGVLETRSLLAAPRDLLGIGTINAAGLASDLDLVFAQPSDLEQSIVLTGQPGQHVSLQLDLSADQGELGAGYIGNGSVTIRDGMQVFSQRGGIGYQAGSSGKIAVIGAGSQWSLSSQLGVGNQGAGFLQIAAGGMVSMTGSAPVVVGFASSASGSATIDGPGSQWNCRGLTVGAAGAGSINITHGGSLQSDSGILGSAGGSSGSVAIDGQGSHWNVNDSLTVGLKGDGSLSLSNGGTASVANDAFFRSFSDYAVLDVGVGPNGPGRLNVGDVLGLDALSRLQVSFLGGFVPAVSDSFTIAAFDSLVGTFAAEPAFALAGDYLIGLDVHYNAHDITVEAVSSVLAADFDGDGHVDGEDLTALRTHLGLTQNAQHAQGDADGDGDVDASDFLIWQRGAGLMTPAVAAPSVAVPEPTTAALSVAFAAILFAGRTVGPSQRSGAPKS